MLKTTKAFMLVLALLVSLIALPGTAVADDAAIPSSTPRIDVPRVTNGAVLAIEQVGSRVFVAGSFTKVTLPGGTQLDQQHLFAYDAASGAFDTSFRPVIDRQVNTITPGPGGAFFIGGKFSTIDGRKARKVARFDSDLRHDRTFAAVASAEVTALEHVGDLLYVGGNFKKVNGTQTQRLAAVDQRTGALDLNFGIDLSAPVGAGGFMGVKSLDVSDDGSRMVMLASSAQVGGVERVALSVFDTSQQPAVLTGWHTNFYRDRLAQLGGQLRLSSAAIAPDGSYFVAVTSGGDAPPTNNTAVAFPIEAGNVDPVEPLWISRHFDSIYAVDISASTVFVGGHFQFQEAPGSIDPYPGEPGTSYGNGNGLGPAVLGDQVVRRSQIGALDPATGKSLDWNPGANGFRGVTAVTLADGHLLVGHDGTTVGGMTLGRFGAFPLTGNAIPTPEPDPTPDPDPAPNPDPTPDPDPAPAIPATELSAPGEGTVHTSAQAVVIEGTAAASAGVDRVQITIQERDTKKWLRSDGSFGKWEPFVAVLADPGSNHTSWQFDVVLPPGRYRALSKTFADDGAKDPRRVQSKFEVVDQADASPETQITRAFGNDAQFSDRIVHLEGTASDDVGVTSVGIAFYNIDTNEWLTADGTLGGFSSFPADLTDTGAVASSWSLTMSIPEGNWRLQVAAVDTAGQSDPSVANRTIRVFPADVGPAITLDSPTTGDLLAPGVLTIDGVASDDIGVARVYVRVRNIDTGQGPQPNGFWGDATWISVGEDANGNVPGIGTADTPWSFSTPTLPAGRYIIEAYADDTVGQSTRTPDRPNISIDVGVAGDDAPDTAILTPTPNQQAFDTPEFSATGTATDDLGVSAVRVAIFDTAAQAWVQPDGSRGAFAELVADVASPDSTETTWSIQRALAPGTYRVEARAIDTSGQPDTMAIDTRRFALWYPGDADPSTELRQPLDGSTQASTVVDASGRAFDDIGVAAVQVRLVDENGGGLRIDGTFGAPQWIDVFVTNPGGEFTDWSYRSPSLPSGNWRLDARSVDSVGKTDPLLARASLTIE